MIFEHRQAIPAAPALVFALNTGIERWPSLTPTVTSVDRLDSGPLRVGSQARLKQPGQPATVWTVRTLEPDATFIWDATVRGMRMVASHIVEPTPEGCVNRLVLEISGRGASLFGRLLGGRIRQTLQTENDGFRAEAIRQSAEKRSH